MKNEHGYCPSCNMDFDDDLIFDTFFEKYGNRKKALEVAEMYGATESKGRWGKQIGIYSMEKDRTVQFKCPECDHIWNRNND